MIPIQQSKVPTQFFINQPAKKLNGVNRLSIKLRAYANNKINTYQVFSKILEWNRLCYKVHCRLYSECVWLWTVAFYREVNRHGPFGDDCERLRLPPPASLTLYTTVLYTLRGHTLDSTLHYTYGSIYKISRGAWAVYSYNRRNGGTKSVKCIVRGYSFSYEVSLLEFNKDVVGFVWRVTGCENVWLVLKSLWC